MKAKAIGTGADGAQSTIEESYSEEMSIEEAETLALRIMKEVMEKKLSTENVEMCVVTAESGYTLYSSQTIDAILERLE
jgi:20S proteasome subunit alpha 5